MGDSMKRVEMAKDRPSHSSVAEDLKRDHVGWTVRGKRA
jgi:hypothetical protein